MRLCGGADGGRGSPAKVMARPSIWGSTGAEALFDAIREFSPEWRAARRAARCAARSGKLVALKAVGATVAKATSAILESMPMEHEIRARTDGVVSAVSTAEGAQVAPATRCSDHRGGVRAHHDRLFHNHRLRGPGPRRDDHAEPAERLNAISRACHARSARRWRWRRATTACMSPSSPRGPRLCAGYDLSRRRPARNSAAGGQDDRGPWDPDGRAFAMIKPQQARIFAALFSRRRPSPGARFAVAGGSDIAPPATCW